VASVPKTTPKPGRPSKFTEELAADICRRLAEGESLRHICLLPEFPDRSTIIRWIQENESFRNQYAQARELQADYWADEIQDIANDGRNDWEIRECERTGKLRIVINAENVQRSRLRVDTLKWIMSKQAPKRYGDKIEVENTGKPSVGIVVTPEVLAALQEGYKELKESFK
jgi:hypothetical protein